MNGILLYMLVCKNSICCMFTSLWSRSHSCLSASITWLLKRINDAMIQVISTAFSFLPSFSFSMKLSCFSMLVTISIRVCLLLLIFFLFCLLAFRRIHSLYLMGIHKLSCVSVSTCGFNF